MNCSSGIEQKNYCVYQWGVLQEAGVNKTGNKTIEWLTKKKSKYLFAYCQQMWC